MSAEEGARPLRVLPLDNTQAHALTCSKRRGSLGHHFRALKVGEEAGDTSKGEAGIGDDTRGDALAPSLQAALASLRRLEWVGLTDLMSESLCLLHYQANGSLPAACVCADEDHGAAGATGGDVGGASGGDVSRVGGGKLGAWTETRSRKRDPASLPAPLLAKLDEMTAVDAALFAVALRLLLGRLRTVEAATGKPILRCVEWAALWRSTRYVPGLWDGKDDGLLLPPH